MTEEEKYKAYWERNQLVAILARIFPSHLAKHPIDPEWDPEWKNIVCIHTPVGQLSWHIHVDELKEFSFLQFQVNDWDGHTTEEKYERLKKLHVVKPTFTKSQDFKREE